MSGLKVLAISEVYFIKVCAVSSELDINKVV